MDILGWFHGREGFVRLLAVLTVPIAACAMADTSGTASQRWASLRGADVGCFKMCSAVQEASYAKTPVDRCALTHELCRLAKDRTTPGYEPMIEPVPHMAITCHAAELAACQSGDECRAYGEHMCQLACEDAWSNEQDVAESNSEL